MLFYIVNLHSKSVIESSYPKNKQKRFRFRILTVGRQHTESGRPEEFHLQYPTVAYVNLSIHTSPASHNLEISRFQAYTITPIFIPHFFGNRMRWN